MGSCRASASVDSQVWPTGKTVDSSVKKKVGVHPRFLEISTSRIVLDIFLDRFRIFLDMLISCLIGFFFGR